MASAAVLRHTKTSSRDNAVAETMTVTASRSAELYKTTLRPAGPSSYNRLWHWLLTASMTATRSPGGATSGGAQWMQANDLSPKTWERAEPLTWRVADPRRMQGMTTRSNEYICAAMAFMDTLSNSNVAERAGGRWPGPDAAAQYRNVAEGTFRGGCRRRVFTDKPTAWDGAHGTPNHRQSPPLTK